MTAPYFCRRGTPQGVPLVLLHGFGGSMQMWDRVLPLLGDDGGLVLFDLPGHGESLNADGAGGAGRMAKAILAALTAEGIERFHLAGHSMGGAVAALIALRAPEAVVSLSLIAPGGMAPEIDAVLLEQFARADDGETLKSLLTAMAGGNVAWPQAGVAAEVERRRRPGALEALQATYAAMFPDGPERGQGVLPRAQLDALAMPVAVLWGTADGVLPCPERETLPASFRVTLLPGAGHMLPEECPQDVADLLNAMRAGQSGTG
ncbi:alpha/beta fold hydrolase [Pseudohoeflea coraliihabitans]|uniref:Alpha/beta fold hydrolase n=1 Tax=Pseudohoeflea coraliihabitans TaxID=2860393 RepID=A0ABS6WJM2_9HYPH|nr:alpha/beta fold hydrolase [Pseudohoeflea sp. DP4N28-3]MBW3096136.1 alpha/beta fold hydrolase [Pseudohoeflea sp. DP4N28-3]